MSLTKVSDLEGISRSDLSTSSFLNGLIEISKLENTNTGAFKSVYARNSEYMDAVREKISSFNKPVYFYNSLALSGNLSCNAENDDNYYSAYFNFGKEIKLDTAVLSIYDGNTLIATFSTNGEKLYQKLDATTYTNNEIHVKTPTESCDAANKQYVDNIAYALSNGTNMPKKFGMFASCDYAIVSALPSTLCANTFYFVLES